MPTPDHQQVGRFTDAILAMVDEAIAEGAVPANVRGFTDLHSYVDANDFLEDAGVPYDGSDESLALTAAVQAAVTLRLGAPTRPYCTFGRCAYPGHDHTTQEGPDGDLLAQPVPLRCADCGHAAHWDAKLRRLRHDDPALDARRCPSLTVGSPFPQDPAAGPGTGADDPAVVGWVDAWVAAATDPRCYDFGPYPAQVTHLPERPGEGVTARFSLDAIRQIAQNQWYAPGTSSIGVPIDVVDGQVLRRLVRDRAVPAGSDGWWHLDDAPWSWALSDLAPEHPLWQPLFTAAAADEDSVQWRCAVCGAVDDIDSAAVPSRMGTAYQDGIARCRGCGSTEVDYAESATRAERAPWPAPAPGPTGGDASVWDGREGLPAGWWRLPHDIHLRTLTIIRAVDGLMLSTDLHDGFALPGPAYLDLRPLTTWDTSYDIRSAGRAAFEALNDRLPGRFTTVLDLHRPGTVFLTVALLCLTDEVTDAILDQYRAAPIAQDSDDPCPAVPAGHDCRTAGALAYVADYGAPGVGQAWTCTMCGRGWSRVGGVFSPAESGAHILSPRDVE